MTQSHNINKIYHWAFFLTQFLFLLLSSPAMARELGILNYKFSLGNRIHVDHSEFVNFPVGKGDMTYLLYYECHQYEDGGFWQLGAGYTPHPATDEKNDYIITPQLNLLFKNKAWSWGGGVLKSYLSGFQKKQWSDLYGQLIIGYSIPFNKIIGLDINGYYLIDKWDQAHKINYDQLEFGFLLNFGL